MELIRQGTRLRVLHEIGVRGSFSAAADALGMSQSAVSQPLAALETSLGLTLVERGLRPVQLTEAGSSLARHTAAVITRLDNAEQELAEISGRRHGRLRLGSFPTALATFVPGVLARFQQRLPDVDLTVVDDHVPGLVPRLVAGELDLAIVYDHRSDPLPRDLDLVPVFDDDYRVVLPRGHHLAASGRDVALTDLREENWIGGRPSSVWFRIVRRECQALGFEPRTSLVSDDYVAVLAFVAAQLGVAVVPGLATSAAGARVEVRPLRGPAPTRRIWAARIADPFPSKAVTTMAELLGEVRSASTLA